MKMSQALVVLDKIDKSKRWNFELMRRDSYGDPGSHVVVIRLAETDDLYTVETPESWAEFAAKPPKPKRQWAKSPTEP